jgi:hypothetical protein
MVKDFFSHVVEQYPQDLRRSKYEYWQKLRTANHDYARESGDPSPEGFQHWMRDRWGLTVEMIDGGWSPYYNIVDEKKYLLFKIKYG